MEGTVPITPNAYRRSTVWILWSVGGGCLLATVALVLWFRLPRWAPGWVVAHSPFVEPVLRAAGDDLQTSYIPPHIEMFADRVNIPPHIEMFADRVKSWGPSVAPQITTGLSSPDPAIRRASVRAVAVLVHVLRVRPASDMIAALIPLLGDTREYVRGSVAHSLGASGDPTAVVPLLAALAVEQQYVVAVTQARALGRLSDRRAFEPLASIVAQPVTMNGQSDVVAEALEALLKIDKPQAMPVLVKSLTHVSPYVRVTAVELLGQLKYRQASAHLLKRIGDPETMVRGQAVLALATINDEKTIDPLLDRFEDWCFDYDQTADTVFRYREHSVPLDDLEKAVDRMSFTEAQHKRWEDLRKR